MKTKLLISDFETCDDHGLWSKGLSHELISTNDCIIRSMNYDNTNILFDDVLSPLNSEISSGIDTIIHHIDIDNIEYNSNYKNIVVYNLPHFIKRNRSILDKLSIADELWVFDEQSKEFLGSTIENKIKIIGYPYPKDQIAKKFENKVNKPTSKINFYTITDINNIENIDSLIYNFLLVFHSIDVKLIIYIKNTVLFENIDNIIKKTLSDIKSRFKLIDNRSLDDIITILSGNPYMNPEEHTECHTIGHCYINIDYIVTPDIFTASYLGKHILSIIDIGTIIKYNEDNKILTFPANYRVAIGDQKYYNEFNSFPKINDISLQNKLIDIYTKIKNNVSASECYEYFNHDKLFSATKEFTQ